MTELDDPAKKPLIGFFPDFSGLGESYILIKVARRYVELGGEVVFFSHGGEYEQMARDDGFKIIKVKPDISKVFKYLNELSDDDLIKIIKDEALIYADAGIKALVQKSIFFGCILAPRIVKIPVITITSGTWTPNYFRQNLATFPDDFENFFTRLLPSSFKNRIFNWIAQNPRGPGAKKIIHIAKKLGIQSKDPNGIIMGNYTLAVDDMDFLGLKPTRNFPAENYVGPVLSENLFKKNAEQDDLEIERHLKKPGRSILISLGSGDYPKELFLRILKILNNTPYNVIAVYTTNLNENELPKLNDNILLKKFVPSISKINKMVDLTLVHGGLGTVYTASYSAKPVIGIPNIHEQQCNLDCLVRHGTAIRLSKKYFKDKDLLDAIDEIFDNYDYYSNNAQSLAKKLIKPEGEIRATDRIIEFVNKELK